MTSKPTKIEERYEFLRKSARKRIESNGLRQTAREVGIDVMTLSRLLQRPPRAVVELTKLELALRKKKESG